jgi:hypothetical protein
MIETIIGTNTLEKYELVPIVSNSTLGEIEEVLLSLINKVNPTDIVLCAWAIPKDNHIDYLFEELGSRCFVVAAAGNTNELIDAYIPASSRNTITVGALNKSNKKATMSNYSEIKELEWVVGTNYKVNGRLESGTSVSAALYAAFLAEAILQKNPDLLIEKINHYNGQAFSEIA